MPRRAMVVTVLVLLVLPAVARAAAAGPRFSAPVYNRSEHLTDAIIAADLNGDGNPDLATSDDADDNRHDSVSVLFGTGHGHFRRAVTYRGAGGFPGGSSVLAAGDLNGDGRPELIESNDSDRLEVLVNRGYGRFRRGRRHAWGELLAAADVNGDGKLDLVLSPPDGTGWDAAVRLGTGDGRFGPVLRDRAPKGSVDGTVLGVADVNGDGKADIVRVDLAKHLVAARLSLGDGTFGADHLSVTRYNHSDLYTFSAADLNGDGKLDLVLAGTNEGAVYLLQGNGDGTFSRTARVSIDFPFGSLSIAPPLVIADFDGDGHPDLATDAVVSPGLGDGRLGPPVDLPLPYTIQADIPESVWPQFIAPGATADFNRDGRPDLALGAASFFDDFWWSVGTVVLLNSTGLPAAPCVVLPVTHRRLAVARRAIVAGGCRLGHVRFRHSRRVRKGRVMAQRPRAATVLPALSHINLVVSRGRRR